ncbi:MAG: T9SS type A sorting domain-containing protein [Flavobacterium sp.]|nr:T9SS type A sorting domain-containing protein [Flavobacterium sp.]
MKKILYFIVVLISLPAFSQLYVGNTYAIYAKNEVVFVNQNIELQSGANFYLRNEAQLLQGSVSTSTNKGLGQFSVFQEGNSNNFAFNYWCAPVGNASATIGNENFGITMLGSPVNATTTTPAIMLSGGPDGIASPLSISDNWIYTYLSSATFSGWNDIGSATTIAPGQGFTMKGTGGTDTTVVENNAVQNNSGSAQRYDFRGKPNDGNIAVNVAPASFTLTGNPYPSALNMNAFLLDAGNTACTGIAYYWEQDKTVNSHYLADYKGGYGTYSPINLGSSGIYVPAIFNTFNPNGTVNNAGISSGLTAIERKYAPIGQGFIIEGAIVGSQVTLKNTHRSYYKESTTANSYFSRNSNSQDSSATPVNDSLLSFIRFNINIDNQFTRQLALVFASEATDSIDHGIEAEYSDAFPNDTYFLIEDGKYVIQGVAFDAAKKISIGLNATANTTFSFSIAEAVNFDLQQPVYVHDKFDDSFHDIRTENYVINPEEGNYSDRYEITFVNTPLALPETTISGITIYQDNDKKTLTIDNKLQQDLDSAVLFDISGKQIYVWDNMGTNAEYFHSTSGLSAGIYLIKISMSGNKFFTQKIAIK